MDSMYLIIVGIMMVLAIAGIIYALEFMGERVSLL